MEINTSSKTYQRFIAGRQAYIEFFEGWGHPQPAKVGFCCMMRTIYFWRPLIFIFRSFFMGATILLPIWALRLYLLQVAIGAVTLAVIGIVITGIVMLAMKIEDSRVRDRASSGIDPNQVSLLVTWVRATHDKICPLVEFREEEDVQVSE